MRKWGWGGFRPTKTVSIEPLNKRNSSTWNKVLSSPVFVEFLLSVPKVPGSILSRVQFAFTNVICCNYITTVTLFVGAGGGGGW